MTEGIWWLLLNASAVLEDNQISKEHIVELELMQHVFCNPGAGLTVLTPILTCSNSKPYSPRYTSRVYEIKCAPVTKCTRTDSQENFGLQSRNIQHEGIRHRCLRLFGKRDCHTAPGAGPHCGCARVLRYALVC